ncbi:hypothetical protein ACFLTH_02105 [Bacteroidota bacterium]
MNKPHIVNAVYSIYIILIGFIGFLLSYYDTNSFQFTSLIPAAFGIILLLFTKGVIKEDKFASHAIVMITLVLALMVLVMLILNIKDGFELSRKVIIFILIIAGSFTALGIYIKRFISIKKKS